MNSNIIQFNISKNNDFNVFKMLLNDKNPSQDRINLIFKKYPKLSELKKEKNYNACIKNFINNEYINKKDKIKINLEKTKKEWKKIEPDFIKLSKFHFQNINFSNLEIKAYPSLWPLFIKDIKNNKITFPCSKSREETLFVIAHESLHIIFFKYLKKIIHQDCQN